MTSFLRPLFLALLGCTGLNLSAQTLLVYADTLHTMAGPSIKDAVIVISDGKIVRAGPADSTIAPRIGRVIKAAVVTPGLIDAHSVLGLSGQLNQPHDQDQLDKSAPLQADLRAIDAYNAREPLVPFTRSLGITTINTGHAPRALVSGTRMSSPRKKWSPSPSANPAFPATTPPKAKLPAPVPNPWPCCAPI